MTSSPGLHYDPELLAHQALLEQHVFTSSYTAVGSLARRVTDATTLEPPEKMMLLRLLPDDHPTVLDGQAVCGYYCEHERPDLFGIGVESLRKLLDNACYRGYVRMHEARLRQNAEFYGTPWLSLTDDPTPLHAAIDEINRELDEGLLTDSARRKLEQRRAILAPRDTLRSRHTQYPEAIVERLCRRPPRDETKLAFTITTCRRLSLFQESMNAFLNCCLDLDRIDTWILIDDNSSEADRAEMRRLYPFVHFIERGPAERGHERSLNCLWKHLDEHGVEHVFHMEDDRVFLRPKPFIGMGMEILQDAESQGVAQVVFSRHYSDSWNDWYYEQGYAIARMNPRLRYVLHCGYDGLGEFGWQNASNRTWPHFSLNPSLIHFGRLRRTEAFVPRFVEGHDMFEFEFAVRYARAGLRTAFPDDVFVLHVGKLHWEQHTLKKDAYELNRHSRFGKTYRDPSASR